MNVRSSRRTPLPSSLGRHIVAAGVALATASAGVVRADEAAPAPATTPTSTPTSTSTPTPSATAATTAAATERDAGARAGLAVVVLDVKGAADTAGVASALTTLVTNEFGSHPGFRAVSRNEVKAIVAHQAEASLLGCNEPRCAADVARLVDADRVVTGEVARADDGAVVLSLSLIDPTGPTVLDRVAWTWRAPSGGATPPSLDGVLDLARPAVDRLTAGAAAADFSGGVDVVAPAGAVVLVDGKELGAAPRPPLTGLSIGVHAVAVQKPGFLPWTSDVAVTRGENRVVVVDLVDEASVQPVWARWYVWGSALAGAVVIGGTVAAVGTWNWLNTPSRLVVGAPK